MSIEKESKSHRENLLLTLETQRQDVKYCDFVIKVGEEKFHVHRNIIVASSKYFEAMLSHSTKEKTNGFVELRDVDPKSVKLCIEFIYTGKVVFSVERPNFLIYTSELFNLTNLTDLYFEFLLENMNAENCFLFKELSQTYNRENDLKTAEKFISDNFEAMTSSVAFKNKSQWEILAYINSLSGASGEGDILKWKAATRWVKGDVENRSPLFLQLLKYIDLGNLPKEFVENQVQTDTLIKGSAEGRNYLVKKLCESIHALKGATNRNDVVLTNDPNSNTTKEHRSEAHIIFLQKGGRMLYDFDCPSTEWSRIARIPQEASEGQREIICIGAVIYVLHKQNLMEYSNGMWKNLSNLKHEPQSYKCVSYKDLLYVLETDKTSRYIPDTNTWVEVNNGHQMGEGVMVTASTDYIYALGGKGTEKKAKEFDTSWDIVSDMLYGRCNGGAASSFRDIYAIGGYGNIGNHNIEYTSIECYTTSSNRWTKLGADLSVYSFTLYNLNAFVVNDNIYINAMDFNKMYVFNIGTKKMGNMYAMSSDSSAVCLK